MASKPEKSGIAGLIHMAGPQKGKLFLAGLFAIAGHACGIVPFYLVYLVVAEFGSKPLAQVDQAFIYYLICGGVAAIVVKQVSIGISYAFSHVAAYNILHSLRVSLAEKMRAIPLGYFNRKNTGQLKKVITEDVEQMELFLAHNIPEFVGAAMYLVMTTVVLFMVDWRLALTTVLVLPFGFAAQILSMGQGRPMLSKWIAAAEKMNAAMIEYIQGMPIIKAFNHTVSSFSKYSSSLEECYIFENDWCRRWYLPITIFSVSITANILLLLPVGAGLYLAGAVTLQTLVFFLLMSIGFGNPVWLLVQFGRVMGRNIESLAQIEDILNAPELPEPAQPEEPGQGVFGRRVDFSYDGKNRVIHGADFAVSAARFVALVGPSGAGKTTLARLIPRFWDVEGGAICLGQTDIRKIRSDDLWDRFGLIFQNVHLFNDTVLANLLIGRPDASEAEVIEAAKTARCHDFIMELPEGYHTVIGEKGARISGGEKQRISIARALLKQSPVLILDEATAFIDPENEALVQEAINKLVRGKTLIVIAHRLSTITAADEILVLDKGRIAAKGSHDELLAANGLYKNMWESHVSAQSWKL